MWISKKRIVRRRLRLQDMRVSSLNALEKPLAALGFQPKASIKVFLDLQRPLCAYTFSRGPETLSIFFSRARPFWFIHDNKRFPYRSMEFGVLDELEAALARYFKIPNFSPKIRPVIDWPIRKRDPVDAPNEEILPCTKKTRKQKASLP